MKKTTKQTVEQQGRSSPASQPQKGETSSAAELEKVTEEEATANISMKNLRLAMEEATQEHDQAWLRKRAAGEKEVQQQQSALATS